MKKILLLSTSACMIAGATIFMAHKMKAFDSQLLMQNVEAIAGGEIPDGTNCCTSCPGEYCGYAEIGGQRFSVYWRY